MSQSTINKYRRHAVKVVAAGVVAIPLASLSPRGPTAAGELPHLSEDDPTARALSYVHNAAEAPAGKRKDGTYCHNCNLIEGTEGAWRGCALFRDKAVNENGWCVGWVGRV